MKYLCPDTGHNWQTPVITEKLASDLMREIKQETSYTYLAVPWASIIDKKNSSNDDYRINATKALNKLKELPREKYITVCQHYRYKELTQHMIDIGIEHIYTPHAMLTDVINPIDVHSFPLFATNAVNPSTKTIKYSFIGAYMDHYISDIRKKIFKYPHGPNTVIISRDRWQYNDDVYMKQVWDQPISRMSTYLSEQKTRHYRYILSRSRFSLCPSGAGPNSIRIFESLASGAIPVIFADGLELPDIKEVNWAQCVLHIPESQFESFEEIINSIDPVIENQMRANCIEAYKYVSGRNFIKCILQKYNISRVRVMLPQ